VLEADQLFATLDPTTRAAEVPDGRKVLLTDTVGFIQKLPTDLVAAFRATLEEVTEADLILHVLDASHPAMREHFEATNEVLGQLNALDKLMILALNKIDLLDPGTVAMIRRRGDWTPYEEVVAISARTGAGIESLMQAIERATQVNLVHVDLLVPYDQAGVEAEVREHGRVISRDYLGEGIRIEAEVPANLAGRFAAYVDAAGEGAGPVRQRRPSR
jgi:GTP-binding protein HflX